MVNDNFDLHEEECWDDDNDDVENYFLKLYNNGQLYKDERFGT